MRPVFLFKGNTSCDYHTVKGIAGYLPDRTE